MSDLREPSGHERMREQLRKVRAAQLRWTAAKKAHDAALADIKRIGIEAHTWGNSTAQLVVAIQKPLDEAASALSQARNRVAEDLLRPEFFNILWNVFGLGRED